MEKSSELLKECTEKIKVSSAEIVVHGTREKPYYEIKYNDLSDGQYHVGYSSYNLDSVFEWMEECFEIVDQAADTIESLSAKLQAADKESSDAKKVIRKLLCSEYGSSYQFCAHDEDNDAICIKAVEEQPKMSYRTWRGLHASHCRGHITERKEKLIDRDLLLSEIKKSREKNPHNDSIIRANHTIEHDHIACLVLEQPIVYTIDKLVEKLEEMRSKREEQLRACADNDMANYLRCKMSAIAEVIEIVESGGIE